MRWDFSSIMVVLLFVSGAIWAADAWIFAPRRRLRAAAGRSAVGATASDGAGVSSAEAVHSGGTGGAAEGGAPGPRAGEPMPIGVPATPILVEYARSFFPVFLIVLLLRSFLIEPFRIPSASMMPTLVEGDFIVVDKFSYGIRLPVVDRKIIAVGRPERGDVVVFRFPGDGATPFIKRIVGLPGDRIRYQNKTLYINGEEARQEILGTYVGRGSGKAMTGASLRLEHLDQVEHEILVQPGYPTVEGEWVVPPDHYFVLGDNRDNSRDSRFWGFVPDENLIGRAFRIWMNWDWGHGITFSRIGEAIR